MTLKVVVISNTEHFLKTPLVENWKLRQLFFYNLMSSSFSLKSHIPEGDGKGPVLSIRKYCFQWEISKI